MQFCINKQANSNINNIHIQCTEMKAVPTVKMLHSDEEDHCYGFQCHEVPTPLVLEENDSGVFLKRETYIPNQTSGPGNIDNFI